jgi:hypothetical protein
MSEIFLFLRLFCKKYFIAIFENFIICILLRIWIIFHHRWLLCLPIILFNADDCKIIYFITLCVRNIFFRHLRGWGLGNLLLCGSRRWILNWVFITLRKYLKLQCLTVIVDYLKLIL